MKFFYYVVSLAIFISISVVNLNARDNPFIPTKSYMEKKAEMIDTSFPIMEEEVVDSQMDVIKHMPMKKKMMAKKSNMMTGSMLSNGKHNILPFVMIDLSDESMSITSSNQLFKKFDLKYKMTKKIVFDFKSSKGFYSKRNWLESENFKHIAVGSHPKKGFFRIAISVEDLPSNYDIVYEGDTIHIMKAEL